MELCTQQAARVTHLQNRYCEQVLPEFLHTNTHTHAHALTHRTLKLNFNLIETYFSAGGTIIKDILSESRNRMIKERRLLRFPLQWVGGFILQSALHDKLKLRGGHVRFPYFITSIRSGETIPCSGCRQCRPLSESAHPHL